jgi:vacuolar iron transporter family protein
MPATRHIERHFTATETVRDIVIGMADGLTVPFALAAGLAGAVDSAGVVVVAGLAEISAGAIAMGLGGYLAAKTDAEHYAAERARELRETHEVPQQEVAEVAKLFREYGLSGEQAAPVVAAITANRTRWVDFMMRFELGLEEPDPKRATRSAITIAAAYVVGGLIPLAPYMILPDITDGLRYSVVITFIALAAFGYVKSRFIGISPWKGALQTVLTGGIAATAAFLLARLIE